MTSVFLTMPEDPTALPSWLERQLVGPNLRRLAEELAVLNVSRHGPGGARGARPHELTRVLSDHRQRVLEGGLSRLPRPALTELLRWPPLLLELQELVLTEGGSYWDRVPVEPDVEQRTARIAQSVRASIASEQLSSPQRRRVLPFTRLLTHAATALATAAALLLVLYSSGWLSRPVENRPSPAANWGFAKLQQLPRPATDAETLERLAALADEWKKKTPSDAAGLAQRIGEFRQGCAALQLADRLPLSDRERDWLSLRCSDWAAELDAHLRRLEATRDVPGVLAATDRTVARLTEELRQRAAGLRAG